MSWSGQSPPALWPLQLRIVPILLRQYRLDPTRPDDADLGIVPAQPALQIPAPVVGGLVENVGLDELDVGQSSVGDAHGVGDVYGRNRGM